MLLNRALYALFVAFIAFSPVLGMFIADRLGYRWEDRSLFAFMWVGVALSLPVSVLVARAAGLPAYRDYWTYLESFQGNSKRVVITAWLIALGILILLHIVST